MSRPLKKQRAVVHAGFGNLKRELEEHVAANGEGWIKALGELGRPLQEWVDGVIDSKGGETRVTPQMKTAIILAAKSALIVECVDRYLFNLPSIINRSRRQVFGIVMQRKELVASLGRQLADIGLDALGEDSESQMAALQEKYGKRIAEEFEHSSPRHPALPPPTQAS